MGNLKTEFIKLSIMSKLDACRHPVNAKKTFHFFL